MIHYPKAELRLIGKDGGPMIGGPPRGVWHTTETPQDRVYSKDYYHLNLSLKNGVPYWVQLIDLGRASRGLRRPGSLQTNRQGDYCINVAISGYARDANDWPVAIYDEMAEVMLWCEAELGIPAVFPVNFGGSNCYGTGSPCRLSASGWQNVTGWVGHQHVPDNTHWDPGAIPVAELEAKIEVARMALTPEQEDFLGPFADYALAQEPPARASSFVHVLNFYRALAARLGVPGNEPERAAEAAYRLLVETNLPASENVTITRGTASDV